MTAPLKRRAAATQRTLDAFKGKPFKFGRYDCAMLVRRHLVNMRHPVKAWARVGTYHSLLGAMKRLNELGFVSLHEALDSQFERIPPAAALVGDIIALPGERGPGALTVALGNGRVLCWVEDLRGAEVCQPEGVFEAAWRVP